MIAEPVTQAWTPACMAADEWAEWQRLNPRFTQNAWSIDRPCGDCPLGYAADMHAAKSPDYPDGRCNGTPGGVEEDTEMDELTAGGVRVHGKVTTGAGELQVFHVDPPSFRRVALELAAPPCASCAHEPVCALRVAVERLATVETSAPPLPDGLRLSLTATVECSHFLRDKAKLAPVRVLTSQERGQASLRARREVTPEMRENMRQAAFRDQARKRATREGAAAG